MNWYAYILCCRDNTFYAGIAKDLKKRLRAHNSDKDGAKYTRARRPVRLVYFEILASRSAAAKREYQLKKMSRKEKEQIVAEG